MAEAYLEYTDKTRRRLDRSLSLGRSTACEITLNDTECSRRHALINRQGAGEFWLVDLGSTNGTHINGRRLLRPTQLADGDRILIGRSEFIFRSLAPLPAAAAGEEAATLPAIRTEEAWMLLADVENFTLFSRQHPPEEVSRRIGHWVAACAATFTAHQADIQVYLGDGFFAYLPTRTHRPETFLQVLGELRGLQSDSAHLPFRLIVHFDRITLGGAAGGGVESALGPGVNHLFRMEKIAGAAGARCAATTAALAAWPGAKPAALSLGRHPLKGFDGEYELFKLA